MIQQQHPEPTNATLPFLDLKDGKLYVKIGQEVVWAARGTPAKTAIRDARRTGQWLADEGHFHWLHSSSLDHPDEYGCAAIDFHHEIRQGFQTHLVFIRRPVNEEEERWDVRP